MYPKARLLAGFGYDPATPLASIGWTDLTPYLLRASWRYGRQFELDRIEAGRSSFTLDNSSRAFEPGYAGSPFYPNLLPLVPVRLELGENDVDNPRAAVDVTGWSGYDAGIPGNVALVRQAADGPVPGITTSFELTRTPTSATVYPAFPTTLGNYRPVVEGETVYVHAYVKLVSGAGVASVRVNARRLTAAQAYIADTQVAIQLAPVAGQWYRLSGEYVVPAGTAYVGVSLVAAVTIGQPVVFRTSCLQVAEHAQPYVDAPVPVFTHYADGWPPTYELPDWSEVTVTATDGFEILAHSDVVSTYASLTTALAGANNDLVFTAKDRGPDGNSITVRYVVAGNNTPLSIAVVDQAITVNVATDAGGAATSTAAQVRDAVNGDATAAALVTAALAAGNDGTGVVAALAATNLAGGTYAPQLSGTRVGAMLDAAGRAAADRVVDAGVATISKKAFNDADDVKVLAHLQDVAEAEVGLFFCDGRGRDVFHGRSRRQGAPYTSAVATFSDLAPTGDAYPWTSITPAFDKERIVNEAKITAEGGTGAQIVSDAPSQGRYRRRTYTKTLALNSDADALGTAQTVVGKFKEPSLRIEAMTHDPVVDDQMVPGYFWTVISRELSDRIRGVMNPPANEGGGPGEVAADCHIEAIAGDITPPVRLKVGWELSPADTSIVLTLDAAGVPGQLDNGAVIGF